MRRIEIRAGEVVAVAVLNDSRTADSIWENLPLSSVAQTWGDEVYFSIPLHLPEEDAREVVEAGDLGYWPPGAAICIFFGPTPISRPGEIRPASPVNIIGKLEGDPRLFASVRPGERVTVDRILP